MKLNQPFGSVESEIENLNINFKQKNYSEIIERSKGLIKKFPSIIPNLIQALFNGVNNFESNSPKIKKINARIIDHILIFPSFMIGYKAINIKTTKNSIPKLLFELRLFFFIITCLYIYLYIQQA